jgi:hypothetical protein
MWALGLAIGAGIMTAYRPLLGLALAATVLAVGVTRARLAEWTFLTILVGVGVPIIMVGGSLQPSIEVGRYSFQLPVVLIYVTTALGVVALLGPGSTGRFPRLAGRYSIAFVGWSLLVVVMLAYQVVGGQVDSAAIRECAYYAVPVFVVVPFALARRSPESTVRLLLGALLCAATLGAVIALVVYAIPSARAAIYSGTGWVGTARVGFGNASIFALSVPLSVVVLGSRGLRGWRLGGLVIAIVVAMGALAVSQSRVPILAVTINVILVLLWPRLRRSSARRDRPLVVVVSALAAVGLLVLVGAALGIGALSALPSSLGDRMSRVWAYSGDASLQARTQTNRIAIQEWRATPGVFVRGRGLGATIDIYAGGSYVSYHQASAADNSWVTVATKGGLVMVLFMGATLLAAFLSFVRAARCARDGTARAVWVALAVSFPAFLVQATMMSSHYPVVPGVILAVACLTAAADLTCTSSGRRSLPVAGRLGGDT